jgi:hypothetical protein
VRKLTLVEPLTNQSAPVNGSVRIRPGKRNSLRQAIQLQQRVFEESNKPGVKPIELAQLARAWDCLEERKRILRNKPLPGSLKPQPPRRPRPLPLPMPVLPD